MFICIYSVTLDSSSDSVCPGDTVVFTCTTDTGVMLWSSSEDNHFFYADSTVQGMISTLSDNIIILNLTNVTGLILISTATVHNVSIADNEEIIECSDSSLSGSTSAMKMIILGLHN